MKSHNDDDNNSDNGAAVRKALEKRKCDLPLLPNTHTQRNKKSQYCDSEECLSNIYSRIQWSDLQNIQLADFLKRRRKKKKNEMKFHTHREKKTKETDEKKMETINVAKLGGECGSFF